MDKVSIIILAYNKEKFIDEAIDSAIKQTYPNTEVIVIDDGSTDRTKEIAEKFTQVYHNLKVISKQNGGISSALNRGIKEMTGDWFKWLSGDDVLKPNCVKELMKEVDHLGKEAENMIFYSNYEIIDEDSKHVKYFIEKNRNNQNKFKQNVELLHFYYGNATTSLIHKSAFEKIGKFDEEISNAEDYDFWLRACLLNNYQLRLVDKVLAEYREHKNQLTLTMDVTILIETANYVREKNLRQLPFPIQLKYEKALKKLKSKEPIKRKIRNIMFKILPHSTCNKLINQYRKRKLRS